MATTHTSATEEALDCARPGAIRKGGSGSVIALRSHVRRAPNRCVHGFGEKRDEETAKLSCLRTASAADLGEVMKNHRRILDFGPTLDQ